MRYSSRDKLAQGPKMTLSGVFGALRQCHTATSSPILMIINTAQRRDRRAQSSATARGLIFINNATRNRKKPTSEITRCLAIYIPGADIRPHQCCLLSLKNARVNTFRFATCSRSQCRSAISGVGTMWWHRMVSVFMPTLHVDTNNY